MTSPSVKVTADFFTGQSAGAVEYAPTRDQCPRDDIKPSDGKVPELLWGM